MDELLFADSNQLKMAIAIYDSNGQLISFAKMHVVSAGSAKVVQWKG